MSQAYFEAPSILNGLQDVKKKKSKYIVKKVKTESENVAPKMKAVTYSDIFNLKPNE